RMGYPAPVKEEAPEKKADARAPSEKSFRERGTGAKATTDRDTAANEKRPSVRARLEAYKAVAEAAQKTAGAVERVTTTVRKDEPER
ncbi:MAG: hypothetical protein K6G54_06915, partial [Oscillospiraceae bacterium]|nr:hypothetical protein [Oscillospiraceae bacterium]